MEDNELEMRFSAKQFHEILKEGLKEYFDIHGEVTDFRIIEDRVMVVFKLD